jgi:hypothetical protein
MELSMTCMIRTTAKLCGVVIALAALLTTGPSHAFDTIAYVSATGSGTACTAAQPCPDIGTAVQSTASPMHVVCLNGSSVVGFSSGLANLTADVDCPAGIIGSAGFSGANQALKFRHVSFYNGGSQSGTELKISGNGSLILEDCTFTNAVGVALDIEPNGPLNIVIKNSRISNGGSGILLKPAAGGSIKVTLDHVTITNNTGGGVKTDTTNGLVTLEITDSEISNNGGNGINAVAGPNQDVVNIKNSIIAGNGVAGVQANGAHAGVLIATTLLDQNVAGATSMVSGGQIFSYGNNQAIGLLGSGFINTPLQ